MVWLMVLAPRLPPVINSTGRLGWSPNFCRHVAFSESNPFAESNLLAELSFLPRSMMFCRTGFPVNSQLPAGKNFSMLGNPVQMSAARLATRRFVNPANPFCSCSIVVIPILDAMKQTGRLAYPPVPMTAVGWKLRKIFRAFQKL